jgi:hypothetical protein
MDWGSSLGPPFWLCPFGERIEVVDVSASTSAEIELEGILPANLLGPWARRYHCQPLG